MQVRVGFLVEVVLFHYEFIGMFLLAVMALILQADKVSVEDGLEARSASHIEKQWEPADLTKIIKLTYLRRGN